MLKSAKEIQDTYNISPVEAHFFQLCFKYKDKHRSYLESHPDCVSTNKPSIDAMACRLYTNIMTKFKGDFKSMFELAGLGVNRLAQEIENGLNAESHNYYEGAMIGKSPDNASRDRNKAMIMKVMGLDNKTVEIHKEATADLDLSKLDSNELNDLQALLTKAKKDS